MVVQEKILGYFSLAKKCDKVASSYLFVGEEDLVSFGLDVARLVNCQEEVPCGGCMSCRTLQRGVCSDLLIINEPRQIKIEHIREAQRFLNVKSTSLNKKVLIINAVHTMREEAANAFLKSLEEPPAHSFIILITSRLDEVLATIISRCRKVYFPRQEQTYRLKCAQRARQFFSSGEIMLKERDTAMAFIMDLIVVLRDSIVFHLTGKKKYLLQESSYEIILALKDLQSRSIVGLQEMLKVHNDLENINLNLAKNILTLCR
jgi:hypothetical protein